MYDNKQQRVCGNMVIGRVMSAGSDVVIYRGQSLGGGVKEGDGEDKDRQSCNVLRSCRSGDLHSELGGGIT